MAEQLLDQARNVFEGQIDFEGQRLAELITTVLLGASGILAFFIGYLTQNIHLTVWIGLAGTLATFAVVVPPWPFYNKNPLPWLPSTNSITGLDFVNVDGKKVT